jgi:hypothetical protein
MASESSVTPAEQALISGYVAHVERLGRDEPPSHVAEREDYEAHAALERLLRAGDAAQAWRLTRAVLAAAPDDRLGLYAAGPLEDAVREHGAALVAEIEAEAARDARFRWALGRVWLTEGQLPPAVLARIVRASGGVIRPLPPADDGDSPSGAI